MKRYAAIDIGSQTIRLLISDCDADVLYPLERDREIVRLGSGMQADGLLLPDRIEQAATCIKRFCEYARSRDVQEILCVATACVRQAHNSQDFIARVSQACGSVPEIINEQQEAELSRAGVQAIMPTNADETVIIDIGGGSTEFSFLSSGYFKNSFSLPLGVIKPAEDFLHTDPPTKKEIKNLRSWAGSMIASHTAHLPLPESGTPPVIIITAGTATTLAAMDLKLRDYVPARINGYVLSLRAINSLLDTMLKLPLTQRAKMPGLEPGRAEVILPGTLIMQLLLHYFGCDNCTVSDAGLLEGIVIHHATLKKIIEKT